MTTARKHAVVMLNLGGPLGPQDVRPFLFNLFNDPAIIGAPGLIRTAIAALISTTRAKSARENYAKMGGGSPLLAETEKQADALARALTQAHPDAHWRVFSAMRYWTPFIAEVAKDVSDWQPDRITLLPLYPQFSTTTTESAFLEWSRYGAEVPTAKPCCYPLHQRFIEAHARLIADHFTAAKMDSAKCRLLFSAHGLPERTIARGDGYQWQVEQTAKAVAARLPDIFDWQVCYQSRVGPLKWIGPSTEDAIEKAAKDGRDILLTPIAFVSEHIETLVELDEEYAELAHEKGVARYERVPALGVHPLFIEALRDIVLDLDARALTGICPPGGTPICPSEFGRCPARLATTNLQERAT
jgi:protoporphyrin/coproporphyrin ferrochelatase